MSRINLTKLAPIGAGRWIAEFQIAMDTTVDGKDMRDVVDIRVRFSSGSSDSATTLLRTARDQAVKSLSQAAADLAADTPETMLLRVPQP